MFSDAGVIVVAHYKGLSVAEVSELRRGMRDAGAAFRVTKNTLARIALADTPYATLDGLFIGPTAIAYSADPIAAPKAAVDFAKRNDKLAIVGGALPLYKLYDRSGKLRYQFTGNIDGLEGVLNTAELGSRLEELLAESAG